METKSASDRFNNRVALTVAILATAIALFTIKAGNVAEAMAQAQAERNNGWAWYQAVRVREDMATYRLADLDRLLRSDLAPAEAEITSAERAAQNEEVVRIRERLAETRDRAEGAEADYQSLNALGDQFDLAEALLAISITLLAVAALAHAAWLYWFALIPGAAGLILGAFAMANRALPLGGMTAWMG